MPYLQVEVDAIDDFESAARYAGIPPGDVAIGLLRLWKHCWRRKVSHIDRGLVAGFVPGDPERVVAALTACGFLSPEDGGVVRVRGAKKRLGLVSARSEAGKKGGEATAGAKKSLQNLKQNAAPDVGFASAANQAFASVGASDERSKAEAKTEALTSNTQHPTPSTQEKKKQILFIPEPPTSPPEDWTSQEFWRWFQHKRHKAGFVPERPPPLPVLGSWWSEARGHCSVERLKQGVYAFGDSAHWQGQNLPFNGFMSQWNTFVPPEKKTVRNA